MGVILKEKKSPKLSKNMQYGTVADIYMAKRLHEILIAWCKSIRYLQKLVVTHLLNALQLR